MGLPAKNREIWIDIVEYGGLYQVSNFARVRSWKPPNGIGFKSKKPRILSKHINKGGYKYVSLRNKITKKSDKYLVGRLVAKAFIPNPHNKPDVNHKDGNKLNDLPYNLEWLTKKEHRQHTYKNNLHCSGSAVGTSVLEEDDVLLIRTLFPLGFTQVEVADAYNVHYSTINKIALRKSWVNI